MRKCQVSLGPSGSGVICLPFFDNFCYRGHSIYSNVWTCYNWCFVCHYLKRRTRIEMENWPWMRCWITNTFSTTQSMTMGNMRMKITVIMMNSDAFAQIPNFLTFQGWRQRCGCEQINAACETTSPSKMHSYSHIICWKCQLSWREKRVSRIQLKVQETIHGTGVLTEHFRLNI